MFGEKHLAHFSQTIVAILGTVVESSVSEIWKFVWEVELRKNTGTISPGFGRRVFGICCKHFKLKAWRESIPTYSYRNRPNSWCRPTYLGVDVQNCSYKQCNAIS